MFWGHGPHWEHRIHQGQSHTAWWNSSLGRLSFCPRPDPTLKPWSGSVQQFGFELQNKYCWSETANRESLYWQQVTGNSSTVFQLLCQLSMWENISFSVLESVGETVILSNTSSFFLLFFISCLRNDTIYWQMLQRHCVTKTDVSWWHPITSPCQLPFDRDTPSMFFCRAPKKRYARHTIAPTLNCIVRRHTDLDFVTGEHFKITYWPISHGSKEQDLLDQSRPWLVVDPPSNLHMGKGGWGASLTQTHTHTSLNLLKQRLTIAELAVLFPPFHPLPCTCLYHFSISVFVITYSKNGRWLLTHSFTHKHTFIGIAGQTAETANSRPRQCVRVCACVLCGCVCRDFRL